MKQFNEKVVEHMEKLELYVPVVAKVHGGTHPEFHEVKRVFDEMNKKLKAAGTDKAELTEEFAELRTITSNYAVPEDTCESYEAVYKMLEEWDQAYKG